MTESSGFDLTANAAVEPAEIVLVTPDGKAEIVAEDLYFPNGSVITPDGRTLIVAETWGNRLTAFDIEVDGTLQNRRIWANLEGVFPDGICLDAEGAIWVAAPHPGEVLRVQRWRKCYPSPERVDKAVCLHVRRGGSPHLVYMYSRIIRSGRSSNQTRRKNRNY